MNAACRAKRLVAESTAAQGSTVHWGWARELARELGHKAWTSQDWGPDDECRFHGPDYRNTANGNGSAWRVVLTRTSSGRIATVRGRRYLVPTNVTVEPTGVIRINCTNYRLADAVRRQIVSLVTEWPAPIYPGGTK
jgi:hypothetical protein